MNKHSFYRCARMLAKSFPAFSFGIFSYWPIQAVPLDIEKSVETHSLKLHQQGSHLYVTGNMRGKQPTVRIYKLAQNLKKVATFSVAGEEELGFAAHAHGMGIVVRRGHQYICYVLDSKGKLLREQVILDEHSNPPESRVTNEYPSVLFWTGKAYGYVFKHTRLHTDNIRHQGCSIAMIDSDDEIKPFANPRDIRPIDWSIQHCLDFAVAEGKGRIDVLIVNDGRPYVGLTGVGCRITEIGREGEGPKSAKARAESHKMDNKEESEDDLIMNSGDSTLITSHWLECGTQAVEQVDWPRGNSGIPLNLLSMGRRKDGKLIAYYRRGAMRSFTFSGSAESLAGNYLTELESFEYAGDNPVKSQVKIEWEFLPKITFMANRVRLCGASGKEIVVLDFDNSLALASEKRLPASGASPPAMVCSGTKIIWLERNKANGPLILQKNLP